jgi:magnesium chelatase accessory protein
VRDGADWPHRACSGFVQVAGQRWHLQRWPRPGAGAPLVVLVHGTGASTHSWRALAPRLAHWAGVLSLDLPGHAFSGAPPDGDHRLPSLARRVAQLVAALAEPVDAPPLLVGHSAGAAILAQAVLDGALPARALVALNGAFLPFGGVAAPLLSPLARLLHALPGVPQLFARRAADPAVVRRLVEGTGSTLDDDGLALYGRLMRDPAHARAALAMMAHWELAPLARALPGLRVPLHLFTGSNDRAVPPSQSRAVAARVPGARLTLLPDLGHLAHEETPANIDALLHAVWAAAAASAGAGAAAASQDRGAGGRKTAPVA